MDAFGPRRIARKPSGLAQRGEAGSPTSQQLVHVGLVAGVPQQDVARRRENPVQGDGELDDTEVGPEVPAGSRDRGDQELADLPRQGRQRGGVEPFEVVGAVEGLQQTGHRSSLGRRVARAPVTVGGHSRGTHRSPRSARSTRSTARRAAFSRLPSRSYAATAASTASGGTWSRSSARAVRKPADAASTAPSRHDAAKRASTTG